MNKNRFAKPVAVAAGFIFLLAVPGLAYAGVAGLDAPPAPKAASPGAQPKGDSLPSDDFAGLNLTDEQKAEIDKIHRDTESRKSVVVKDEKLTSDQKDAMLLGYTHLGNGLIFKVLSSEQQRQVRQRIRARRAADQVEQKKQPPRN